MIRSTIESHDFDSSDEENTYETEYTTEFDHKIDPDDSIRECAELMLSDYDKGYSAAMRDHWKQHFKNKIREEGFVAVGRFQLIKEIIPHLFEEAEKSDLYQLKSIARNTKLTPQKCYALFVTFRPEEGSIPLETLEELLIRLNKKKGVLQSIGTIEQTGMESSDDYGKGIHFHTVLVLNKDVQQGQPSRMTRDINRMFKKYMTKTPHALDIAWVSVDNVINKVRYVFGYKDESKMNLVAADIKFRIDKSLKSFYDFNLSPDQTPLADLVSPNLSLPLPSPKPKDDF